MVFACVVIWLGRSLDDGSESKGWCRLDERDVEDFGGHAGTASIAEDLRACIYMHSPIANYTNIVCFGGHFGDALLCTIKLFKLQSSSDVQYGNTMAFNDEKKKKKNRVLEICLVKYETGSHIYKLTSGKSFVAKNDAMAGFLVEGSRNQRANLGRFCMAELPC